MKAFIRQARFRMGRRAARPALGPAGRLTLGPAVLGLGLAAGLVGCMPPEEPPGAAEAEEGSRQAAEVVTLAPDFTLDGAGEDIDSPWFWEAPNPEETLLFVTGKANGLVEVWEFPFVDSEQEPLSDEHTRGVNGVGVDQETDLLYITGGGEPSSVAVYELPSLEFSFRFTREEFGGLGSEPNFGILHREDEPTLVYISGSTPGEESAERIISIHRANTGEQVGMWYQPAAVEALFADPFHRIIYVPDEHAGDTGGGVFAYRPDGRPVLEETRKDGDTNALGRGEFQGDGEGITYYAMNGVGESDDGTGFLIVSDQRDNVTDFEIFDRITWEHIGVLRLEGVNNTDGVASTQRPLPGYPLGIFAAVDNDRAVAIIGWDRILEAFAFGAPD